MEKSIYDCAVVGTGIAGVSAALTLHARNKHFIWFGSKLLSEKIAKAERIFNYPGCSAVSGAELQSALVAQIRDACISVTEGRVTGIYPAGEKFSVLAETEAFEAKTVILATGMASGKPVAGERELLGRGVSYCATCDGALYRGKKIAVVCENKFFEPEVEFLASIASRVYLFAPYQTGIRASNVEVFNTLPTKVVGEQRVQSVQYAGGELAIDGLFVLKSSLAPDILVQGIAVESGHISVNRACETSVKGLFAAGDCTGRPYQYAKAAGEGNVAAHSAIEYLNKLK